MKRVLPDDVLELQELEDELGDRPFQVRGTSAVHLVEGGQDTYGLLKTTGKVKKADPVKDFTSFAEAGDASLQLIATLHASRLSNWGFIGEADMRGLTQYKLNAMLDNRTSEFCRMINGKVFTIDQARGLVDRSIYADNPEDLREIQPWPLQTKASMDDLRSLTNDQLAGRGFHVPPFHPGCRTMMTRVDTPSPLGKTPAKNQVIPAHVSTAESFEQLGLDMADGQIKVWNDYVGMHPATVLQTLTGKSVAEVLAGGWKLKVTSGGNVKIDWLTNSTVLNPLTNTLAYKSTAGADALEFAKHTQELQAYAQALGVSKITLRVNAGDAADALASGFVPSAVEWQAVKAALKLKLAGPLAAEYEKLPVAQKVGLFTALASNLESSALDLADLPRAFLVKLVADLKYSGSLVL